MSSFFFKQNKIEKKNNPCGNSVAVCFCFFFCEKMSILLWGDILNDCIWSGKWYFAKNQINNKEFKYHRISNSLSKHIFDYVSFTSSQLPSSLSYPSITSTISMTSSSPSISITNLNNNQQNKHRGRKKSKIKEIERLLIHKKMFLSFSSFFNSLFD